MGLMEDAKRAAERSADLAEMSDAKRVARLRAELADKKKWISDLEREYGNTTKALRVELAEAKAALEIAKGINAMRHELTDPGAQERRMERIADRMRDDKHKETLGTELSKALDLASKLEVANARIAELEALVVRREFCSRAESAEAEMLAERNGLRALLALAVQWAGLNVPYRSHMPDWVTKARATLAPSPAGREG